VPAFVGAVRGPTQVGFFIDENEFDPKKLIEVDLAKNTQSVAAAQWAAEVECDHQTTGGLTTIGPKFHDDARHVGCVYLTESLVTKYATALASWPPQPDTRYQYQLVVRSVDGNVARYHGFKARVVSPANGTLARLALYRTAGTAPSGPPQWFDLADPAACDPESNGFTTITPSSPVGFVGAVFLSSQVVALDGPSYPKIPRNLGW
jgi:hypothetical protein